MPELQLLLSNFSYFFIVYFHWDHAVPREWKIFKFNQRKGKISSVPWTKIPMPVPRNLLIGNFTEYTEIFFGVVLIVAFIVIYWTFFSCPFTFYHLTPSSLILLDLYRVLHPFLSLLFPYCPYWVCVPLR